MDQEEEPVITKAMVEDMQYHRDIERTLFSVAAEDLVAFVQAQYHQDFLMHQEGPNPFRRESSCVIS
ncbi:Oidioi.mRNA.OKI2018_I69.chr2.g5020.t1.cds [Oikopleura dioica]|uniref:Oidioi.mRNA.OKI2018_I69.chr2.g5020.t1.cds n=1 Tax=Oikopleura dioica TaxID=34765 RepID=A0ABN7T4S7_OIKDI|nr:Oidioi.mRNA.OKI2018_I69.chr2.g5020.t1.cds [Oikopleura dioica]